VGLAKSPVVIVIDIPPEEEKKKRKREEGDDPEDHEDTNDESTISQIIKKIDELNAVAGAYEGREIQAIAASLKTLAAELEKEDNKSLRKKGLEQDKKVPRQEQRKTTVQVGTSTRGTNTQTSTTCDAGTQTLAWHHTTRPPTVGSLERVKSFSDFEAVAGLKWEEAVFKNVEVKVGNPLDTPHHTVKCVLVEPKDRGMNLSIGSQR
jgi:hypothetical protein